jgi:acylphosphatase
MFRYIPILVIVLSMAMHSSAPLRPRPDEPKISKDCCYKGFKLYGKIKFVENFPDIKVQIVENFPDLKVRLVENFPDDCGEWQIVENFPDLKVQIVENFPDIKVKFVNNFPGLP